jgi:hypothetical protein
MAINPALITTIRVGELPIGDIELTSKIGVENGTDLQQVTGQNLIDFVNINAIGFQFEIKDLWVSQTYIDDNFDNTGFGVNLCVGYAICNGQNGTPNLDGLVSIGYGNNYNVIKAVGGSKNAQLIEHTHILGGNIMRARTSGGPGNLNFASGQNFDTINETQATGTTDGINKNMQPYMVLLKIMKL